MRAFAFEIARGNEREVEAGHGVDFLVEEECFETVVVLENEREVYDALSPGACTVGGDKNRMQKSRVDEVRDDRVNVLGRAGVEHEPSSVRGCRYAADRIVRWELDIVFSSRMRRSCSRKSAGVLLGV